MGTISDKLTYLNETKGKIKDAINLTNANILSEDTFRSYAEKLKLGLIDIINNGTSDLYDSFPKTTGAGTEIALNDTYEAPMEIGLNGNTSQNGTPTPDSPIDIQVVTGNNTINVHGKNLLNTTNTIDGKWYVNGTISDNANWSYINQFIKVEPNTKYTISRDENEIEVSQFSVEEFNQNKTFVKHNVLWQSGTNKYTVTTDSNTKYIICQYRNDYAHTNLQFNIGEDRGLYEPYQSKDYEISLGNIELCKIGDYQDKIDKSTGKNLFNKDNITSITNGNLSNDVIVSNAISMDYGGVSANINSLSLNAGTYYISMKVKRASGTNTYNINRITLVGIESSQITMVKKPTLSGEYQIYTCRISPSSSTNITNIGVQLQTSNNSVVLNIKDIMISTSNDDTYEPYGEQWYIKKAFGKVVFDGTEDWYKYNMTTNNLYRLNGTIFEGYVYGSNVAEAFCNIYGVTNLSGSHDTDSTFKGVGIRDNGQINIWTSLNEYPTLADFKNMLLNKNMTIVGRLKDTTYEIITSETLINQLEEFKKAKSVDDKTLISQINEQLPFILDVSALSKN